MIGALTYCGLDTIGAGEKDTLRQLVMSGGPHPPSERQAILDYCETDVVPLGKLLARMMPNLDLPRALLRGRYMPDSLNVRA